MLLILYFYLYDPCMTAAGADVAALTLDHTAAIVDAALCEVLGADFMICPQ